MDSNKNMNMKSLLVIIMMIALVLMAILPLLNMVPVAARDDNPIPIPPIPPIYPIFPDMIIECLEDTDIRIELDLFGSSLDDISVKYSGDNLICSIIEDYISIIPKDNWYGDEAISIDILDEIYGWQRIGVAINVIPVNDAPEIIAGPTDVFMTSGSEI